MQASDAELVAAAMAGDGEAFGTLARRWFDRCWEVAWRILHDQGLAADVAQDALVTAWRRLDRLREPGSFGGWVLRIARNRALDRLEQERRAVPAGDDDRLDQPDATGPVSSPEHAVHQREAGDLVWAAAAALGARDSSLLDLHLRHGLEPSELADELGIAPNAAHQALFRLRNRLGDAIRAFVVWHGGDPACVVLRAELTAAGDPGFGRQTARLVLAHVDGCLGCAAERDRCTAPAAMFSAVPLMVVPAALRTAALDGVLASIAVPAPPADDPAGVGSEGEVVGVTDGAVPSADDPAGGGARGEPAGPGAGSGGTSGGAAPGAATAGSGATPGTATAGSGATPGAATAGSGATPGAATAGPTPAPGTAASDAHPPSDTAAVPAPAEGKGPSGWLLVAAGAMLLLAIGAGVWLALAGGLGSTDVLAAANTLAADDHEPDLAGGAPAGDGTAAADGGADGLGAAGHGGGGGSGEADAGGMIGDPPPGPATGASPPLAGPDDRDGADEGAGATDDGTTADATDPDGAGPGSSDPDGSEPDDPDPPDGGGGDPLPPVIERFVPLSGPDRGCEPVRGGPELGAFVVGWETSDAAELWLELDGVEIPVGGPTGEQQVCAAAGQPVTLHAVNDAGAVTETIVLE